MSRLSSDTSVESRSHCDLPVTDTSRREEGEDDGRAKKRNRLRCRSRSLVCCLLLLSVLVVGGMFGGWPETYRPPHLEPSLRAMRAGLLLSIWIFGHTLNTLGWRNAQLHSVVVFEWVPPIFLNFERMFVAAVIVSLTWIVGLYLVALAPWLDIPVYVGPLVMYGIFISLLLLVLPIVSPRSGFWLLKKLVRVVCAPIFYITFADFWIAEQITSLTLVLLDTEYFICHLSYGRIAPSTVFACGKMTYGVRMILLALPMWWRMAQCMRRYYNTHLVKPHLLNASKYGSYFFVVVALAVFYTAKDPSMKFRDQSPLYYTFLALYLLTGTLFISYTTLWEIFIDWNLFPHFHCCGKNSLSLRKKRMYKRKIYYVLLLVENISLHVLWGLLLSIAATQSDTTIRQSLKTVAAVLEVIRKIIWNFFRLENEYVSNVGQFLDPTPSENQNDPRRNHESKVSSSDSSKSSPTNTGKGAKDDG